MNWIDAASDVAGVGNTDVRGWRFAPHGWVVAPASLDLDGLTEPIIVAFAVSNGLGRGFLEAVYRNRLSKRCAPSGWLVMRRRRRVMR
jgi:hypothetical protein